MEDIRASVVGVGATGLVLSAALTANYPETLLIDPRPGLRDELVNNGIGISGAIEYQSPVLRFSPHVAEMGDFKPNVVFIATKTFHLQAVLDELEKVFTPGMKIVSTHNGLGTEDLIADRFGPEAAFRMSLNFGVALKGTGRVETAFFNRPNHLGSLTPENQEVGRRIAGMFSLSGLDTEYVDDIKLFVWKKMIMKCTMASICAVTDRTISEALQFPPTREIAFACFQEALSVAKGKGYDLGDDYLTQAMGYLEKVGAHKDSMCVDIANRTRTEIDFLGGMIVEYGRELGLPTPYYITMTNLVKQLEDKYL